MPSKDIPYRHICEGIGGTLSRYAQTTPIGTRNCITCVGVYFPVVARKGVQKCFAAHINAAIFPKDRETHLDENGKPYLAPRVCEGDEGATIREMVKKRLQKSAEAGEWKVAGVDKTKVVVVCSEYNGKPIVGKFVVEAIRDFLEMGDELFVHDQCHGFVFDAAGGPPELLLLPEKNFLGGLDMDKEAENGTWDQVIDNTRYLFMAEDISKDEPGMEDWCIFLEDGAVPMAERDDLVRDMT